MAKILLVEIGKIIGRRRLTKNIQRILHAFCTQTHSPKKLTPFYQYILVFGDVPTLAHVQSISMNVFRLICCNCNTFIENQVSDTSKVGMTPPK